MGEILSAFPCFLQFSAASPQNAAEIPRPRCSCLIVSSGQRASTWFFSIWPKQTFWETELVVEVKGPQKQDSEKEKFNLWWFISLINTSPFPQVWGVRGEAPWFKPLVVEPEFGSLIPPRCLLDRSWIQGPFQLCSSRWWWWWKGRKTFKSLQILPHLCLKATEQRGPLHLSFLEDS